MPKALKLPKFVASITGDTLKDWEEQNNKYVANRVKKTVDSHAEKVAARARDLVPVKSGLLKSTIRVTKGKDPLRAIVKTDHQKAPHDFLVHFGTVKSEGRPFLYEANEQLAHELPAAIQAEFKGA